MSCQTVGGGKTRIMPGWACCGCRTYNSLRRVNCKACGHGRCDVGHPAADLERPPPREHIDITDTKLIKSGKDSPEGVTLAQVCKAVANCVDSNDEAGACEALDREFLAGAWAYAFKVLKDSKQVQYTEFARDIRGLVIAIYKLGLLRGGSAEWRER